MTLEAKLNRAAQKFIDQHNLNYLFTDGQRGWYQNGFHVPPVPSSTPLHKVVSWWILNLRAESFRGRNRELARVWKKVLDRYEEKS